MHRVASTLLASTAHRMTACTSAPDSATSAQDSATIGQGLGSGGPAPFVFQPTYLPTRGGNGRSAAFAPVAEHAAVPTLIVAKASLTAPHDQ